MRKQEPIVAAAARVEPTKTDLAKPETQSAMEQPCAETGLAPCPFCGSDVEQTYQDVWCFVCNILVRKSIWNKRVPLTPSSSSQPQVTKELRNDFYLISESLRDLFLCTQQGNYCSKKHQEAEAAVERLHSLFENTEHGWIKTADRPPTKEDGDAKGRILAADGSGFTESRKVDTVLRYGADCYPLWMKIPPVPKD